MLVKKQDVLDWYRGKKERGARIAALPSYHRHAEIDWLNRRKWEIRREQANHFSLGRDYMHGLNIELFERHVAARRRGFSTFDTQQEARQKHRRAFEMMRGYRLNSGGLLARMEAKLDGFPPYVADASGYLCEDEFINALNAGIKFHELTLKMTQGQAICMVQNVETRKIHNGLWTYEPHKKDADAVDRAKDYTTPIRIIFYFSEPSTLLWFKFRYG